MRRFDWRSRAQRPSFPVNETANSDRPAHQGNTDMIRNLTFLAAAFAFGLAASSAALATPRIVEHGDGPHVEHDAPSAANLVGGSVARIFGADDERSYVSERVLVTRPGRSDALSLIEAASAN